MDNGYGTVDYTGGQSECEERACEYKLRSVFKLHAKLYPDEFADNRILSPSKGGELLVLVGEVVGSFVRTIRILI